MSKYLPFQTDQSGTTLIDYKATNKKVVDLSSYTNIKTIHTGAFNILKNTLEEIIFPESLEMIERNAFWGFTKLKSVQFPKGKTIKTESNPFNHTKWYNMNIQKNGFVMIGHNLLGITNGFNDDNAIKRAKRISNNVFMTNPDIESVDLSQFHDLEYIESHSFYDCHNLKEVMFASDCKVKTINFKTFAFCLNLAEIVFPDNLENIVFSNEYLSIPWFQKKMSENGCIYKNLLITREKAPINCPDLLLAKFYAYKPQEEILDLNDLNNVEYICSNAFDSINYRKIILPKNLKVLNSKSFIYCPNLNEIEFPDSIKEIKEKAFYGCQSFELDVTRIPINTAIHSSNFTKADELYI